VASTVASREFALNVFWAEFAAFIKAAELGGFGCDAAHAVSCSLDLPMPATGVRLNSGLADSLAASDRSSITMSTPIIPQIDRWQLHPVIF